MIERDATAADLPAIDALYRDSFIATFGHLYQPHDLAAFLADVTLQGWAEEFATPGHGFRVVEDADGVPAMPRPARCACPPTPARPRSNSASSMSPNAPRAAARRRR